MPPKFRNWVWTINNPQDKPDGGNIWWTSKFGDAIKYGICQLERGNIGETLHLQGYTEFRRPVSGSWMQKRIPGAYHTRRNGTAVEARAYCRKEDTRVEGPWEYGEFKETEQGHRSDLQEVKDAIDKGDEEVKIWDAYFGTVVKYHAGIGKYMAMKQYKRQERTEWEVHVGSPGTGKTTSIQKDYPNAYWKNATKWWDGYSGQKVVVLDEFVGWITYHELMRYGDSTELPVEVKGGTRQFVAALVVLISNKMPWQWYKFEENKLDRESLFRRIDSIYFHRKNKEPKHFLEFDVFLEWYKKKFHEFV